MLSFTNLGACVQLRDVRKNTHDSAELRLRHLIPSAEGPMSVHRLDIETSGLMVFALNASTQSNLSKQFQKRLLASVTSPSWSVHRLKLREQLKPH